jgi:hypothetical protein
MPNTIKTHRTMNRAAFSRVLLGLSVSAGVGFAMITQSACLAAPPFDQCDAKISRPSEPSCGCESNIHAHPQRTSNACKTCKPACGLSFAEKFLKKLDEAGDRFEASRRKVKSGQCDSCFHQAETRHNLHTSRPAQPSCGCEACSSEPVYIPALPHHTPAHPPVQVRNSTPGVSGAIGDKLPKATAQEPTKPSLQETKKPIQEPALVRAPFEPRTPPAAPPTLAQPVAPPVENIEPPKLPSATPDLPALPDVLVDPFKDDPTAYQDPSQPKSIQLTSARRTQPNALRLRTPHVADPMTIDAPEPLTDTQRDATRTDIGNPSMTKEGERTESVVPIAYQQVLPVRVSLRSSSSPSDPGDEPRVSRIAVPRSR